MLEIALAQAEQGAAEGGVPIGAALFDERGNLIGKGRNRRVQHNDASAHAETDAFRRAGRRSDYTETTMVTTLAPCWYCSGLIRQFGIGRVVIGESRNFEGGKDWLTGLGVEISDLDDARCVRLLAEFIQSRPEVWNEDIGK